MKILTQLLPVEQTGSNCKSVAIAAIDKKYAEDLNEPNFPLHKTDQDSFSIRQLAKQHGSFQGELLEICQMTDMLTDLGYENQISSYQIYTEFLEQIQNSLQRGALLIAFFAVNRETREPSTHYDGGNEHAAIIHGIEEEKQHILLHITHDGKNQTTPAELLFASTSVLPNQREPEYYYKVSHKRKYHLHPQQTDESLKYGCIIKSIIPVNDNGFKQKFIVIKKPECNELFKKKRKNLIDNIEFKEPLHSISTDEMKAIIEEQKDANALRLLPWLKNEIEILFKSYPSFLQPLKQEILELFEHELPDLSLIESKFNTLTSLLQPYKALSQNGLFKRLKAAGYPVDKPGQCYGVAQMAMRAFLLGDMNSFLQRLHRIQHTPPSDFKDHFATIKVKDTQKYHEFHAFFDYVMLLQHPYVYTGSVFHNGNDIEQRKNHAYDLLETHENQPIEIGSLATIYSETELSDFFDNIKKNFNGISFSLILIANTHAINLNYIDECDQWLLINANSMPGHRYLTTRFLVKQIMKSLFYQSGYILLETVFYSLKKNRNHASERLNQFKSSVERSDPGYFHRSTLAGSSLLRISIKRSNWQEMCDLIFKGVVLCSEDMKDLLAIHKRYPHIVNTILHFSSNSERLMDHLYEQLVYKNFNVLLQCIELFIQDKNKIGDYLQKKFSNLSDDAVEKIHAHFNGYQYLNESLDFLINYIDPFSKQLRLHDYFENFMIKNGCVYSEIIKKLILLKHTDFRPSLELVHLMIIDDELDILSLYKNRGFIFKSEHLNGLGDRLCEVNIDDIPVPLRVLIFFWDIGIHASPYIVARLIRNNQVDALEKLKNLGFKFGFNHLNVFHHHYPRISLSPEVLGFFWSMGIQPSNDMVNRLVYQNQLTAIIQLRDRGFIFNSNFLEHALMTNNIEVFLFLANQTIKLEAEIIQQYIIIDNNQANMAEYYPFFDSQHLSYALWCRSTSFILPLLKKNIRLSDQGIIYMSKLLLALVTILIDSSESDYLSDSDCMYDKHKNQYSNILQYLINERPDDYGRVSVHLNSEEQLILSNHLSLNSSGLGFFSTKSNGYLAALSSTITHSL